MIEQVIFQGDLEKLKIIAEQEGIERVKCNSELNKLASIHLASSIGDLKIVKFLLEPPINEDPNLLRLNNFAPLHSAAMNGNVEIVEYLISRGAEVNIQTDPQKYAPIHSASFGGHLETIRELIKKGASINLKNYRNELPIDTARRQNQIEVVRYFEELEK